MRILNISNHTTQRCGVAEFGRQLSQAVRDAGHEVTDFEGGYPACHARGYFPEDWYTYDVVHLNWQPNTLNHYQPEVFGAAMQLAPDRLARDFPQLSVFLHDLPPWSTYNLVEFAGKQGGGRGMVVSALEPHPLVDVVIPPPCLAYRPNVTLFEQPTIGRTGIGDAGLAMLETICDRHGWVLSNSSPDWVSNEDEIDRLARCWVNVVWYDYDRSRSSSASIVATARRPTILSECTRFDHLLPWLTEFHWCADEPQLEGDLVDLIGLVARAQRLRNVPSACVDALQWPLLIQPLLQAWEGRR